jgi:predicted transcriptional regulator of viral defense system
MSKQTVLSFIQQLARPAFATHEIVSLSGKSSSVVTQSLNCLARQGMLEKVARGIWRQSAHPISPYDLIPLLSHRHRSYVSFMSALHIYGIIEQIPQVVTLASTAHTRTVHTTVSTFIIHTITPAFFKGFDWYRGENRFLIAEPEKALADSLYLSVHKRKQYGFFPELRFPATFRFSRVEEWIRQIPRARFRCPVEKKFQALCAEQ